MRISERLIAVLACAVLGLAMAGGEALAFDPQKVFQEDKPAAPKIFKFFFKARQQGKQEEAVDALLYAAEQGNHAAQWKLGRMYQTGDGVKKNPVEAFNFFRRVVEDYSNAQPGTPDWQFTASAMVTLGDYYRSGIPEAGIAPDPAEARIMYNTAATYFGHPDGQFEMARMIMAAPDADANAIKAARMLKLASGSGHVGAQALLGQMLFEGRHIKRDAVRGLAMVMGAAGRAGVGDADWIGQIQEESFALASEDERRAATALLKNGAPTDALSN
jgi:TPR repeat protein